MARAPFVLLDDARTGGVATLYRDPVETVVATRPDEVGPALDRLARLTGEGAVAAGFLSYEAGAALEPKLARCARASDTDGPPLMWFGVFGVATEAVPRRRPGPSGDQAHGEGQAAVTEAGGTGPRPSPGNGDAGGIVLSPAALAAFLGDPAAAHAAAPHPLITETDHAAAVAAIHRLIAAGDIYQANLTFPCAVPVAGDPLALYAGLRRQGGGWGGVVFTGAHWLLSASPELFFTVADGVATARPMKGTARRLPDPAQDAAAAAALVADPKQRAENLMIVDLMRNDLAHVARPGGVAVPALFARETYPTVHHMTSTVTAALRPDVAPVDVLRALFPCGSITGAPKIRAMQVIADTERHPRGPYTGAIGRIGRCDAAFSVAIRTLVLADGAATATLGLGSAIVADSRGVDEWAECMAKGAFVTAGRADFDLLETMRFDAVDGFVALDRHMARMKASAEALGFAFDRHGVGNELQAASFRVRHDARVRLRLARSGATAIEITPLPPEPDWPVGVRLLPCPVAAGDFRLAHKVSDRGFYDRARRAAGTFEAVFHDADGFATEGSFTTIFIERDGMLRTPPLGRGVLPGTLRARLIEEGRAVEQDVAIADLSEGFLLGNALRGLFPARLVAEGAPLPL